jgi:hypothetical protein
MAQKSPSLDLSPIFDLRKLLVSYHTVAVREEQSKANSIRAYAINVDS